jgi:hypothetical protein
MSTRLACMATVVSSLMLTLMLAAAPAFAAGASVNIAFDQTNVTIGRTIRLAIQITNSEPNPIRATSFRCIADGTALSASSISQLPATIAANGVFNTEQYYRAASAGTTTVHCELAAVNTVTGAQVTASSPALSVVVQPESKLNFNASSATRVATVGQAVFVIATYDNVGRTTFNNIVVSCVQLGRSLESVSTSPTRTTLPPGQSAFVQSQWRAVRPGFAPIACSITATDASTGATVNILAPNVNIEVR